MGIIHYWFPHTQELSDPSYDHDSDTDSTLSLHQNVGTTCINIVEENNEQQQHESVSCVLINVVENLEERQPVVPEKWTHHYCSSHKILLVGDGDFSFSASLARAFGSATNMVATSLDSRVMLHYKYTEAMTNLKELKGLGCTIIHEVDCCTMSRHYDLKFNSFDRIVYNFPHSGFFSESTTRVIKLYKRVLKGFLRNAVEMLTEGGEVHITHKTSHPFNMWGIEKACK